MLLKRGLLPLLLVLQHAQSGRRVNCRSVPSRASTRPINFVRRNDDTFCRRFIYAPVCRGIMSKRGGQQGRPWEEEGRQEGKTWEEEGSPWEEEGGKERPRRAGRWGEVTPYQTINGKIRKSTRNSQGGKRLLISLGNGLVFSPVPVRSLPSREVSTWQSLPKEPPESPGQLLVSYEPTGSFYRARRRQNEFSNEMDIR